MRNWIIGLLLLGGCATTEGYNRRINSWIGIDVSQLLEKWGPPTSEYDLPNGNRIYTWRKGGEGLGYIIPVGGMLVAAREDKTCTTHFEVNKYSIDKEYIRVMRAWAEGNGCKAE